MVKWQRKETKKQIVNVDQWFELDKRDEDMIRELMRHDIEYEGFKFLEVESITINHKAQFQHDFKPFDRHETFTLKKPIRLKDNGRIN